MSPLFGKFVRFLAVAFVACQVLAPRLAFGQSTELSTRFEREAQPLLKHYCLGCHSTEKQKGDLDLERFTSAAEVLRHAKIWQGVVEQIGLGEMPPKEKPQLTSIERERLLSWVNLALDEAARAKAGDPGPVVLRRLNNAEYTYTVRDLTGVPSLSPAREFPADSAAGEGFMNTGNALVMSPALLTKYLDAAKEIASHAVLLPDGLGFSSSTFQRDWTEERLAAIRAFYGRFSVNGGGSAVNLQGIKFDTKDGGVLPLEKYLEATLELRDSLPEIGNDRARRQAAVTATAARHNLSSRYLSTLWDALTSDRSSLLLDPLRAQWRAAKPGGAATLVQSILQWQQALWRFTQVGHIGKRDGPKAWQMPVTPLANSREVRIKLPAPPARSNAVSLFLAVSDAGDGNDHDFAVWENPRLVVPGRPDLSLRDVQAAVNTLTVHRQNVFSSAARCLAAAAEITGPSDSSMVEQLARRHQIAPAILAAWLECLGIGLGETRIDSHMTQKMESAQSYDFVKGWTGADALSVIANSSDQHVRVPGNMKPRGVAVHPSPKRRVLIGWQSPVTTAVRIDGKVQHAHPECGNGVTWALEVRRGQTRQRLAAGTAQGSKEVTFGPFDNVAVKAGDVVSFIVGPRDGNHSCDLTAVDLTLGAGTNTWDLARDVSPNILAGNPHPDRLGHSGVWHFYSEPDRGGGDEPVLPAGSLLARWNSSTNADERQQLAGELQSVLTSDRPLPKDSPDALLRRQLVSLNGPLFRGLLGPGNLAALRTNNAASANPAGSSRWGVDPALFGRHPNGVALDAGSLCVRAPSLLEVRLPAELAEGCEFVATASLHRETGAEGSVQMQALTAKPAVLGLAASAAREQGGKSTWSDGERPVVSDSPILVTDGSAARRRIESALDEFRQLFPAALCYTKIVPVDEVVTLTLYYREDDALRRLVLEERESAELDRLWAELHYVSHDALKLVDAFEQLWQFATQDADPSAFEPMREPIKQKAEEFRKFLKATQTNHLDGVVKFARTAYRRPLLKAEEDELRVLYARLRSEEIPHEQAIRLTLSRVLVAPAFLYRAEKATPGDRPGPVTDWELATRLSYFLWSSAPDEELRTLADQGRLHEPDVLVAQARRLLRDPRIRRLATEFACTWLHIYGFDELSEKSERHFPSFAGLRESMYEETILFFADLFQRDGRISEILDADHTFLNEALAKHYGVPETIFRNGELQARPASGSLASTTNEWRRVNGMSKYSRGGILSHATTLARQSGASRTSPILRGNWVAEVLLGEKLPRPPKDVPRLPEDEATEQLTVRELTEKHSNDPKCYGCHRRIDPYGYALESFDAIGRFRDRDLGGRPIQTRTRVMDGAELDGLDGLRRYLLTQRRDAFEKQFCRKLVGYALGRGVLLSDGPLITEMRQALKTKSLGAAFEAIVRSKQFREIRGRDMAADD